MKQQNTLAVARPRPRLGFLGFTLGWSTLLWVTYLALGLVSAGCGASRGGVASGHHYGSVPTVPGQPGPAVIEAAPLSDAYTFRCPPTGSPWGVPPVPGQHEVILPSASADHLNLIRVRGGHEWFGIIPPFKPLYGFGIGDIRVVFTDGSQAHLPAGRAIVSGNGLTVVQLSLGGSRNQTGYIVKLLSSGNSASGRDGMCAVTQAEFSFEVTYRPIRGGQPMVEHWGPFLITGQ